MCVGAPGEIIALDGQTATLDVWGERRVVQLELLEEPVAIGDWVLAHLGFAVRVIPKEDVEPMLDAYATMFEHVANDEGAAEDPPADA